MNDKLKRLAKNITELLLNVSTPQDTYYSLRTMMVKQKDYFQHMSPENIIKLTIYCYSFAETGSFDLGDKMLNNIGFAVLFINSGDNHLEDCDNCSGNGELGCDVCDGDGRIDCDVCDSSGEMECPQCSGSGEIDNHGEIITCDECAGEGIVSCDECGGDGRMDCNNCNGGQVTCDECDGNGTIETDEFDYTRYFIVTWNKYIKERCEYTEGDTDITMSEYDFDRLRDEYIKLNMNNEDFAKLAEWVDTNELYCTYYNDNPKMYLRPEMFLDTSEDNMKAYIER
jgi:hypothetical protein